MKLKACVLLAYLSASAYPALAQPATSSGVQGTAETPMVLPAATINLNPVGTPTTRLLNSNSGLPTNSNNSSNAAGTGATNLNFGTASIGRLSPPAGSSGVSGIGRIGPPGNEPNLFVNPNLGGPPTQAPAGMITPITNNATTITPTFSFGGPNGSVNPPNLNPTNPSGNFQVNPTGGSDLRNPSNNYRP
jgi:hypothetical protein